jgi:hypothetical protein
MAMPLMGGMSGLLAAANQGQFAVDPVAGQALGASIADMRAELQVVLARIDAVGRQVPLGDLPEAQHVAQRNVLVAQGDQQSAFAVLVQFDAALEAAEEAVRRGMSNYAEVEEQSRQRVTAGGTGTA